MKAFYYKTITKTLKLIFLILIFQSFSYAQESFSKELTNSKNEHSLEVSLQKSDLEINGINSSLINSDILQSDLVKLRNFNFSGYRNYYNSQEVQIENGPKIILYSIEKMISLGQNFDYQFLDSKKNVDETTVTHPIIPLINIGFGKITAPELH